MVTLATLKNATAQEVYDQIVNHLRKQRKQSLEEGVGCRYRSGDLKCAAGCLIADDEYDPEMEENGWISLMDMGKVPNDHSHLIQEMQGVHDGWFDQSLGIWEEKFEDIAKNFKLVYSPPTKTSVC